MVRSRTRSDWLSGPSNAPPLAVLDVVLIGRLREIEHVVEERFRSKHDRPVLAAPHLPVPARIGQLEALFAEIAGIGQVGRVLGGEHADQRAQVDGETLVEGTFDRSGGKAR